MNSDPVEPRRHFAKRVAQLQLACGLSDEELAGRAGLGTEELVGILRGDGPVPLDVIFLLAGALDVEPGDLLSGMSWRPEASGGGEYRTDPSEDE